MPNVEAKPLFTATFTCTALAAIVAGPIKARMVRTPGSRQLKSNRKRKPMREAEGTWTSNCRRPPSRVPSARPTSPRSPKCGCRQSGLRVEPVAKRHATDDRADIEEARSHRRNAENIFRVQHSHDERGERDEEDEREHDPREQDREGGLFRRETGRENSDDERREKNPEKRQRAHENDGQGRDLARQSPGRLIAFRRDASRKRRDESGRERALGKKIAQHVRRAERGQERVHVARRAEERGDHHLANQPEHAAAKNRQADDARRLGADSFPFGADMGKKEQRPAICESRKCELIRQTSLRVGRDRALRSEEALVDKRGRDQNQRHANESADPVKLVEIAQVVEE